MTTGYQLGFLAQARWLRGDRGDAETLARQAVVRKHAIDDRNGLAKALHAADAASSAVWMSWCSCSTCSVTGACSGTRSMSLG